MLKKILYTWFCLSVGFTCAQQIHVQEQVFLKLVMSAKNGVFLPFDKAIAAGADINIQDPITGKTPLMLAVLRAPWSIPWFLAHGASVDAKDNDGNTAAHHAILSSRSEYLELLFRCGQRYARSSCLSANNEGKTPLILAAFHGEPMALGYILSYYGEAINDVDGEGNTALHWAFIGYIHDSVDFYGKKEAYLKVIDMLEKSDSSLTIRKNKYGLMPCDLLYNSVRGMEKKEPEKCFIL